MIWHFFLLGSSKIYTWISCRRLQYVLRDNALPFVSLESFLRKLCTELNHVYRQYVDATSLWNDIFCHKFHMDMSQNVWLQNVYFFRLAHYRPIKSEVKKSNYFLLFHFAVKFCKKYIFKTTKPLYLKNFTSSE